MGVDPFRAATELLGRQKHERTLDRDGVRSALAQLATVPASSPERAQADTLRTALESLLDI